MPKLCAEEILASMNSFNSVEIVEAVFGLINKYLSSTEKVDLMKLLEKPNSSSGSNSTENLEAALHIIKSLNPEEQLAIKERFLGVFSQDSSQVEIEQNIHEVESSKIIGDVIDLEGISEAITTVGEIPPWED